MKLPRWLLIAVILICIGAVSFAFNKFILEKPPTTRLADEKELGFAVVELFTSEGCSSCPPADNLLARIEKEDKDKQVYLLAYHVDYWDRQGWKDRFSDAAFTQHQQQYAEWLHLNSVYTPQIVVNGKEQFVGSNEVALKKAISSALKDSSAQPLSLTARRSGDQIDISYHCNATEGHLQLLIALLQASAESKVKAGENAGRVLNHVQIVRRLLIQPIRNWNGNMKLSFPAGDDEENWELIGMLQDKMTGSIAAAAKVHLAKTGKSN